VEREREVGNKDRGMKYEGRTGGERGGE